ncbi:MAG TPA: 1-acyl-sn-glycerol-3-phosphate acyltransferase, partial [Azospira sp.]|nr:1-acyl-sn-glycerol-3-phosphate acyltransferase [Azospira sp.]
IPDDGPALLVCNHVSYVDALVIAAACHRPIRFVMDHRIFRLPLLNFIFRQTRAIPIAPEKEDPAMKEAAFAEVAQALAAGELVALFPEGAITADGELGPFRPGTARILAETPVPVVPLALRGLWGSLFSRRSAAQGRWPWRRHLFPRIALVAGAPLAPEVATPEQLRQRVQALEAPRS